MNHRTCICLLAAATLAACGQPTSPGTPRAMPRAEVTTTATTSAPTTTSADPLPTTTTSPSHQPPPGPPRTTTTTKPPPPPPRKPDRWVLPSELRKSIEEQDFQQLAVSWPRIKGQVAEKCPGGKPCVGAAIVTDPSIVSDEDCFIGAGGISVPDPLYEGGEITFRVNNKTNCPKV